MLAKYVAKAREGYHTNMIELVNVGNQLKLISDEKAENANKHHTMTLVNDVWPRLYGKEAVDALFEKET